VEAAGLGAARGMKWCESAVEKRVAAIASELGGIRLAGDKVLLLLGFGKEEWVLEWSEHGVL
jgi:hypothetical protein